MTKNEQARLTAGFRARCREALGPKSQLKGATITPKHYTWQR
nr:MAG TPA: hypothetical protein [Caudoviricetes sp.]